MPNAPLVSQVEITEIRRKVVVLPEPKSSWTAVEQALDTQHDLQDWQVVSLTVKTDLS